jgi:membrane-bound ClpP family serine protease
MAERLNLLPLLLDEIVLILIYLITRFPFSYFLVIITVIIIKDIIVVHKAWEVMKKRSFLGIENLINSVGVVVEEINPLGQIRIGNEIWKAESTTRIAVGVTVRVWGNEGLCLKVTPYKGDDNEG